MFGKKKGSCSKWIFMECLQIYFKNMNSQGIICLSQSYCQQCWGTCNEPLDVASERTREEYVQIAECLTSLSGKVHSPFNHDRMEPIQLLKDIQHIFYEGEWSKHVTA